MAKFYITIDGREERASPGSSRDVTLGRGRELAERKVASEHIGNLRSVPKSTVWRETNFARKRGGGHSRIR